MDNKQETDSKAVEAWNKLPEEEKKAILVYITRESHIFSGPLPPPETLAQYEKILPGAADKIFKMAHEQQQHRFELDNATINLNKDLIKSKQRGQIIGGLLVLFLAIIGLICTLTAHDSVAKAIYITTIIGVAGIFVVNKVSPDKKKEDSKE